MNNKMIKQVIFPIVELSLNNNFLKKYYFLQRSKYWSADKIKKFQLKKLNELINHAYTNVHFYKEKFSKSEIKYIK